MHTRHLVLTSALALASLAVIAPPASAASTTVVVDGADAACSDTSTSAGSTTTPFCTITAAVAKAKTAGVTIAVNPGVYREQPSFVASGTAADPIVLTGTGPGVVIRGTRAVGDLTWTQATPDGTYAAAYTPPGKPTQVFLDGQALVRGVAGSMAAGEWDYDATAGRLLVNLGGTSPAGAALEAGAYSYGVNVNARHDIVVTNLELVGQNFAGVHVGSGSGVTVRNITSELSGANGVLVDGTSSGVTVRDTTVKHALSVGIKVVGGDGMVIRDSQTTENGNHGISVYGSANVTVANNTSAANSSPQWRVATGIDINGASTNAVVEGNRTYGNQDSGIQVYNGSSNATVRRNVTYDNGDHGLDCLASPGERVIGNTVVGNLTAGINVEGTSAGATVVDNISVDNAAVSPRTKSNIRLDKDSIAGSTVNRNIVDGPKTAKYNYTWGSTGYTTSATLKRATGQASDDLTADPGFVDKVGRDLRLSSSSPGLDSADSGVPGVRLADVDGRAPVDLSGVRNSGTGPVAYLDRGAFERP